MKIPSTFRVGQKVTVKAYTDCFQKHHEAIPNMTIVEMEYINTESIAPYYRIKAIGEDGKGYFYAADRFFEAAPVTVSPEQREDAAVAALLFAYCNLHRRSATRQKWTVNDQRSHDKLKAALLLYMDESTLGTSVMQIIGAQSVEVSR